MSEISILILIYNRLGVSSRCVPKIIDNIGDISNEVLIWDNGSTDGSFDWLCSYKRADTRITKIVGYNKNIGMEATNRLAEEATGRYIVKVDDDAEVPKNFARRLVDAYEEINEERLLLFSWDMKWGEKTFATRSGLKLYKPPLGKTILLKNHEKALINFNSGKWLINGLCRLSPRDAFLEMGGHPKGIIYGVDKHVSKRAAEHGFWGGFYSTNDLVVHKGVDESLVYRTMKDRELKRVNSPKHV